MLENKAGDFGRVHQYGSQDFQRSVAEWDDSRRIRVGGPRGVEKNSESWELVVTVDLPRPHERWQHPQVWERNEVEG